MNILDKLKAARRDLDNYECKCDTDVGMVCEKCREHDLLGEAMREIERLQGDKGKQQYKVARGRLKVSETTASHDIYNYRFIHATAERDNGISNVMAAIEDALKWLDGEDIEIVIYHNKAAQAREAAEASKAPFATRKPGVPSRGETYEILKARSEELQSGGGDDA